MAEGVGSCLTTFLRESVIVSLDKYIEGMDEDTQPLIIVPKSRLSAKIVYY